MAIKALYSVRIPILALFGRRICALVLQRRYDTKRNKGLLEFPGGKQERDLRESVLHCIPREIKEETGLNNSYFIEEEILFFWTSFGQNRAHEIRFVTFVAKIVRQPKPDALPPIVIDDEHWRFAWQPLAYIASNDGYTEDTKRAARWLVTLFKNRALL